MFIKYKKATINIGNGNELVERFKNIKFETVIGKILYIFIVFYFKISIRLFEFCK
jgi:hypothetical protein